MDKIGEIGKENPFTPLDSAKERVSKTFLNHAGVFIGSFLCLICVIVLTTDINFKSFIGLADIGGELFVLMFSSYSMYLSFFDSGKRAALSNTLYEECVKAYNEIKRKIVSGQNQHRLSEYCKMYTEEEIKNVRTEILVQTGLSYDDFVNKYISSDKKSIKENQDLTGREKKAILACLRIKPINITPGMFLKRGRGSARRTPLGKSPEKVKRSAFIRKAITAVFTSLLTAQMAFDVAADPSLAMFATVLMKLLPVVINGFFGYKFGYDHIAVNTRDYISDQTDFLIHFDKWCDAS